MGVCLVLLVLHAKSHCQSEHKTKINFEVEATKYVQPMLRTRGFHNKIRFTMHANIVLIPRLLCSK